MYYKKQVVILFLFMLFLTGASFGQSSASNSLPLSLSGTSSVFSQSSAITVTIPVVSGWNIVSVPVDANDMTITSLFPTAATNAFGFNNGYFVVNTAQTGKGYFIRFNNGSNINVAGNIVSIRQINVTEGWNIIGPFETNVNTSQITTTPSGIIATQFFGFNNGYVTATVLEKGKGYWVRVTQSGTINLP